MHCQHILYEVSVNTVALHTGDAFHAGLLDVMLNLLHQDSQGTRYWLEEPVQIGEVCLLLSSYHWLALAVEVGQMISHHPLLALPGHLLITAGIKELPAPHVLSLNLHDDPLHVVRDVSLPQKLGRLLSIILASSKEERLLKNLLVQI